MAFNDGGPAFPQLNVEVLSDHMAATVIHGGSSLWDEYAKAALTGYRAANVKNVGAYPSETRLWSSAEVALAAARDADAMIAEREKRHAQS